MTNICDDDKLIKKQKYNLWQLNYYKKRMAEDPNFAEIRRKRGLEQYYKRKACNEETEKVKRGRKRIY